MTNEGDPSAFFTQEGDLLLPTDRARGPWNPETLSGWAIAGLLAHATEAHQPEGFHVSRLTVDMFRTPPYGPASLSTNVVRDGSRVRVVDATLSVGGQDVARSSAVMLKFGDDPEGTMWVSPDVTIPAPDSVAPVEGTNPRARAWDMRHVGAPTGQSGRKIAWARQRVPLVEGIEASPFVRIAMQSDYTNPYANSGDSGLVFINADVTLYLHRPVVGEWLALEVIGHRDEAGVAVGTCRVHDERGEVGLTVASAISNRLTRR